LHLVENRITDNDLGESSMSLMRLNSELIRFSNFNTQF
jgi:hypothetical protein